MESAIIESTSRRTKIRSDPPINMMADTNLKAPPMNTPGESCGLQWSFEASPCSWNEKAVASMPQRTSCLMMFTPSYTEASLNTSPPLCKCSKQTVPAQRVLFDEMFSSQMDLSGLPEGEFFLTKPKKVIADPAPFVVRPQAVRRSAPVPIVTPSFPSPAPSSLFASIDTDADENMDSDVFTTFESCFWSAVDRVHNGDDDLITDEDLRIPPNTRTDRLGEPKDDSEGRPIPSPLPQIRLKPRPSSLVEGKRVWESISTFASIV